MTRRRAAVLLVLFVAALLAWNTAAIWFTPGAGDAYPSSYSARPYGFRALFEIAESLGADVRRSVDPPALLFSGERRIVLLEPDLVSLEVEKGALVWMADWVREGGQLVIVAADMSFDVPIWQRTPGSGRRTSTDDDGSDAAPAQAEDDEDADAGDAAEGDGDEESEETDVEAEEEEPVRDARDILTRSDLLRNFGLEGLDIDGEVYATVDEEDVYSPFEDDMFTRSRLNRADTRRPIVSRTGAFETLAGGVDALHLPEDDTAHFTGSAVNAAAGALSVAIEGTNDRAPVALQYAIGAGELVLVCQPALFTNVALGEEGNAAAAVRIALGAGDRPVVFDEYYKGRSISGQPLALFGLYPYGVVLGAFLAALLLAVWAASGRLGPALPDPAPPRRSLVEYIRAMAMLFRRGGHTRFVLEVCRRGVLNDIERAVHLPHGAPPQAVMLRLARTDPAKALRLEETLRAVDGALKAAADPAPGQALTLMEKLEACRPNPTERPTPPPASPISTNGRWPKSSGSSTANPTL